MTRSDKKVEQFLKNPASIRYSELAHILQQHGFIKIPAKGSHVKFKHPQLESDLVIPVHQGDCKDFYKKLAREWVVSLEK